MHICMYVYIYMCVYTHTHTHAYAYIQNVNTYVYTCIVCTHLLLFSHAIVSDSFVTPWTVVHLAPLSMGFPSQEYWSGLPFPPPGDIHNPGIKPMSSALADGFFTTEPRGKCVYVYCMHMYNTVCVCISHFLCMLHFLYPFLHQWTQAGSTFWLCKQCFYE